LTECQNDAVHRPQVALPQTPSNVVTVHGPFHLLHRSIDRSIDRTLRRNFQRRSTQNVGELTGHLSNGGNKHFRSTASTALQNSLLTLRPRRPFERVFFFFLCRRRTRPRTGPSPCADLTECQNDAVHRPQVALPQTPSNVVTVHGPFHLLHRSIDRSIDRTLRRNFQRRSTQNVGELTGHLFPTVKTCTSAPPLPPPFSIHCSPCAPDVRSNVYFFFFCRRRTRPHTVISRSLHKMTALNGACHFHLSPVSASSPWLRCLFVSGSRFAREAPTWLRRRLRPFTKADCISTRSFASSLSLTLRATLSSRVPETRRNVVMSAAFSIDRTLRRKFSTSLITKCRRAQCLCSDGEDMEFHLTASTASRRSQRHFFSLHQMRYRRPFERVLFVVEQDLRPSPRADFKK
jgi:hypothetical protein